jgi:alpha-N-arabinofuranosidase
VVDDHFYREPAAMFDLVHHYDNAPRTGPKVFVSEWATRSGSPTPNFGDALGDAAWMTLLERNSDLIVMAAYAPLLANVNPGAMQWATDLIGFDALTSYASPSYYAQCLFAAHLGDSTARTTLTGTGSRFFYSATVSSCHFEDASTPVVAGDYGRLAEPMFCGWLARISRARIIPPV